MKRRTKAFLGFLGVGAVAWGAWAVAGPSRMNGTEGIRTITVERGEVVEKAVATGTIKARAEVEVKSRVPEW